MAAMARAWGCFLALGMSFLTGCSTYPWERDFAAFKQERGGEWRLRSRDVDRHRRIELAADGRVLPGWKDDLPTAQATADQLVASYARLLDIDGLTVTTEVAGKMGHAYAVVYALSRMVVGFGEVPILDARVDVRLHEAGKLLLLSSQVERLAPVPALLYQQKPQDAERAAASSRGLPVAKEADDDRATRLVYRRWADSLSAEICWEVPVSAWDKRPEEVGNVYVRIDGKTAFVSTSSHASSGLGGPPAPVDSCATQPSCSGGASHVGVVNVVKGWCRTGFDANCAPVPTELKHVHILNAAGRVVATTDEHGKFTGPIPGASVNLSGVYSAKTSGPGSPGTKVDAAGDLEVGSSDPFEVAHVTAYYWIEQANARIRKLLPAIPKVTAGMAKLTGYGIRLNDDCGAVVDPVLGQCLAGYTPGVGVYFSRGRDGPPKLPNRAFSTIILHEWGHALDYALNGRKRADGLNEGWADIVAMYVSGEPCVGLGYNAPGACLRPYSGGATYSNGGLNEYDSSLSWSGFAWTLRSKFIAALGPEAGSRLAERLVLGTIWVGTNNQKDAAQDVVFAAREACDPNSAEPIVSLILDAIAQHGLEPPPAL